MPNLICRKTAVGEKFNSTRDILGLELVAIYGNYYTIVTAIVGFLSIVYSSMTAGIGNSVVTENIGKNYHDYTILTAINNWIVSWCTTCLVCLMQPFMRLWVGEDLMLPMSFVTLLASYFYVYMSNSLNLVYKDAAGLWWQDRYRPYIVMTTNLILNIASVKFIGIYGVIFSTVISMSIAWPWCGIVVYKYLFKIGTIEFFKCSLKNIIKTVVTCGISLYLCMKIELQNNIEDLLVKAFICLFVPNIVLLLINKHESNFDEVIDKIKRIFGK